MFEIRLIDGEKIYFEQGRHKLYTGKIEYKDCDGQVIEGKKEGEWLFYNEDGSLFKKEVYKNNILCEDVLEYYPEGRYCRILIDEKGNKIKKVIYNESDIKETEEDYNGEWSKTFYENGNLKNYFKRLEGESSLFEEYYENGQLESRKVGGVVFNNHIISYYKNGQLKKELKIGGGSVLAGNYIIGEVKSYFEDGKVQEINKKLSLDNEDEKFEILRYDQNGNIIEEGIRQRGIETYLKTQTKLGYKVKRVVFDLVLEEEYDMNNILQKRKVEFRYISNLLGIEKGKIDLLYFEKYFKLSSLEKILGYKKSLKFNSSTKKEEFDNYNIKNIYYIKEFIDFKNKLEEIYLNSNLNLYLHEFLKFQKNFLEYILYIIPPEQKDTFLEMIEEWINSTVEIFQKYNLVNEVLEELITNKNRERRENQQNVYNVISSVGRIVADSYHDKLMTAHKKKGQNQINQEISKILNQNHIKFLYKAEKAYRDAFYISDDLYSFGENEQLLNLDSWIAIGLEYLKNKENPLNFLRLFRLIFNNHIVVFIFSEVCKKSGLIEEEEIELYGFNQENLNKIKYFEEYKIKNLDKSEEEKEEALNFLFKFKKEKQFQEYKESKEFQKLNKMEYILNIILGEEKNDSSNLPLWEKQMLSVLRDEKELNDICSTIKSEAQKNENIDYQKMQTIITFINNLKNHECYNYILITLPRLKNFQKTYSENEKFIMKVKNDLRQKEIEKIEYEENRSQRKKLIEQALRLSNEKRKNGKFLAVLILGISIWYGTYGDLIQEYIIPKITEWKFLLKYLTAVYGGIYLMSYYFLGIVLSSILGRLYFNSVIKISSLDKEEKKYLQQLRN